MTGLFLCALSDGDDHGVHDGAHGDVRGVPNGGVPNGDDDPNDPNGDGPSDGAASANAHSPDAHEAARHGDDEVSHDTSR